jgi:hypothetical protein
MSSHSGFLGSCIRFEAVCVDRVRFLGLCCFWTLSGSFPFIILPAVSECPKTPCSTLCAGLGAELRI